MDEIKIVPMNTSSDKKEIANWESQFGKKENFNSIRHFILEDDLYYGLNEVITTNTEICRIGLNERLVSLVAKNKENKIIAWILLHAADMQTNEPYLIIRYLMVHPKFQNHGVGTAILNKILKNPEKYIGLQPTEFLCNVRFDNAASLALFQKFGFEFYPTDEGYLRGITLEPKLVSDIEKEISFSQSPKDLGE